jgi:2-methylcitrate dehydratase PrpD
LKARHKFSSQDVASLHIVSFHEAVRLGQKNAVTTEEAQYSTSFPCALALVHGTIMPQHVADEALRNPEVQRLSEVLSMGEDDDANRLFLHQRINASTHSARGDHTAQQPNIYVGMVRAKMGCHCSTGTGRIGREISFLCQPNLGSIAHRCFTSGCFVT